MLGYEIVHQLIPPATPQGLLLLSLGHHCLLRVGPQHWKAVSAVSEGFQLFLLNCYGKTREHPGMQRLMHKTKVCQDPFCKTD